MKQTGRKSAATLVAALGLFGTIVIAGPAAAQTAAREDTPSVGVAPTESREDDPNGGQWFVFALEPGATARTQARIGNPAKVPQTVTLYLSDLVFGRDGTPTLPDKESSDVGAWGTFDQRTVTIAPGQFTKVGFSITVPLDADPGDHVGAVVAESQPEGGNIKVIKRVATRLYVTVPGDATKSFSITNVGTKLISTLWPRELDVVATLRNTGRVRLSPDVRIGGVAAKGPELLLSQSVEKYAATVRVPWYGGPVNAKVRVVTDAGAKEVGVSLFVIPWHLLVLVPVAVLAVWTLRALWHLRQRRIRGLREDMRRLEKLITERQTGEAAALAALAHESEKFGVVAPVTVAPRAPTAPVGVDTEADRTRALRESLKRAQRTGNQEALERLALSLHDTGEDALPELVTALKNASPERRDELLRAAASYGDARVATQLEAMGLAEVAPKPEPEQEKVVTPATRNWVDVLSELQTDRSV